MLRWTYSNMLILAISIAWMNCSSTSDRLSKKPNVGYLLIGESTDEEINKALLKFSDVEKLIISKDTASGWFVYPPLDYLHPYFDTKPRKKLYSNIGTLKQLKSLDVANIDITDLPAEITELSQLDTLNLALNYLNIADELHKISQLKSLRYLDITNNKIDTTALKNWLSDKPSLTVIY